MPLASVRPHDPHHRASSGCRPGRGGLFELRVFQLGDDDVRACVVPADLAVNLDMISDMSEPVAQAYLNALALCGTEGGATVSPGTTGATGAETSRRCSIAYSNLTAGLGLS